MEVILKNEFKIWNSTEYYEYNTLEKEKDNKILIFGDDISQSMVDDYVPKYGKWKYKAAYNTEDVFAKNYGNPAYGVHFELMTIVLEQDDEKVSLKIFNNIRNREVGKVFFKKSTSLRYLTYNKKTKDLYSGHMTNYHKKRKYSSSVKKNTFSNRPINGFTNILNNHFNAWVKNFKLDGAEKNNLLRNYIHTFLSCIGLDNSQIQRTDEFHYNGDRILFKQNMEKKGIKCSDNYEVFIEQFPLPKKIEAKKYGDRLINIIMGRHELIGGKFKKILHKVKNFNPDFVKYSIKLFGMETIKSLSDEYLIKLFESNNYVNGFLYDGNVESIEDIKDHRKVLEVFKLIINNEINFQTFRDHIRFYHTLNRFEPVKWTSYNKRTFVNEHLIYTEKIEQYSKGLYFRTYSEEFEKLFQKTIHHNGNEYSPILLKDSKSYIEESTTQSNCVKTYISRPSSFIISLRKENDRATIEYSLRTNPTTKEVRVYRVQSLGRFNNELPNYWKEPLEILDKTIDDFLMKNKFTLPKIKVVFKNGIENETKAIFKESNIYPTWEDEWFDAVKRQYNGIINFDFEQEF